MLPMEVKNLYDQLIAGDLLPADFFCIVSSLYEHEEAGQQIAAVVRQLEDSCSPLALDAASELGARYLELFGDLPGNLVYLRYFFNSGSVSFFTVPNPYSLMAFSPLMSWCSTLAAAFLLFCQVL